jgi:DNA polymerase III delta prime subunit
MPSRKKRLLYRSTSIFGRAPRPTKEMNPPMKMKRKKFDPDINQMDSLVNGATVSNIRWLANKYYASGIPEALETCGAVLDKIAPFAEKPGIFTAGRSMLGLLELFGDNNAVWSDCYFDDKSEWVEPFSSALLRMIVNVASEFPYEVIRPKDNSKTSAIKVVDFDGVKVGWNVVASSPDLMPFSIYVEVGGVDHVKAILKDKMWHQYGDKSLVLNQTHNVMNDSTKVEIKVDDLVDALPSGPAARHARNFEKAFAVNEHRSLFLYGPPGSGKSTMARQIAKELNLRSIRFKVQCINDNVGTLQDIVEIFQPGCIIIDDFDRAADPAVQLDLISHIRKTVPLIIATANDRNALDEALLRPERFDELEFVKQLDEGVIRNMLGQYADEAYDQVKDWPIVFINDYVRRRKWLSAEEAVEAMRELSRRVARLSSYDDDDAFNSAESIRRLLKTSGGKRRLKMSTAASNRVPAPPGLSDPALQALLEQINDGDSEDESYAEEECNFVK